MWLARRPEPFDHPDWIYEIKFDGFRVLAHIENGKCSLLFRRRHEYKSFRELCTSIATHLTGRSAILDGEIVCLDRFGRSQFYELMFRRGQHFFYAFDLLWLNGEDLRSLRQAQNHFCSERHLSRPLPRKCIVFRADCQSR
jgi:bifunctional non-homologous end joining protein LigD